MLEKVEDKRRRGQQRMRWLEDVMDSVDMSLSKLQGVITSDTGLMHIAAAFRKPIAVLWGNTIPEFGMFPYMPNQRELFRNFEVCPLYCRPCSKFGRKRCRHKHFKCMNNIPATEVADWVNHF